jgi:hypothetical protein
MEVFGDKKTSKYIKNFFCEICHFGCCKKGDWNRHIITPKHINLTFSHKNVTKNKSNKMNICEICGKEYKSRNGLWNHKKKCPTEKEPIFQQSVINITELVMELMKDHKEMKQIILEQNNTINNLVKNGTHNISNSLNNNNNNNNNNTFNLQFFLNETCKDAMNINDFIESIQLQLSDLENVGKNGYVDGISNIITSNLKALEVNKRPIHCTDKKRETLYIKDENKWEKEDEDKIRIRKVIKRVSNKNIKLLSKFKEVHPDCSKSNSLYSDQYNKIIIEAMGGPGENDLEKEDKIIKNISNITMIDKNI